MIKVVDKVICNNAFTIFLKMIPINPTETAALAVASCPEPRRGCCWIGNSGDKIACVVVVYTELWKRSCWFLVKLTWRLPNIEHEGYLLKLFVLVTANLKNYHSSYHTNHISYCWWWWCYCCWGSICGDNNLLTKFISHLFVWLWLYFVYLR